MNGIDLTHFETLDLTFLHDEFKRTMGFAEERRDKAEGEDKTRRDCLLKCKRAAFRVFEATITYPQSPAAKGQKLAHDLYFFTQNLPYGTICGDLDPEVWEWFYDCTCHFPPGHPWQLALIECLRTFDKRAEKETDPDIKRTLENCPYYYFIYYRDFLDATAEWRLLANRRSFMARLYGVSDSGYLCYAIWDLRETLEYKLPTLDVPDPEEVEKWRAEGLSVFKKEMVEWLVEESEYLAYTVVVATEWLTHSAEKLYKVMAQVRDETADDGALKFGELLEGKITTGQLCKARWDFWKQRLLDLQLQFADRLDDKAIGRLDTAHTRMVEVEIEYNGTEAENRRIEELGQKTSEGQSETAELPIQTPSPVVEKQDGKKKRKKGIRPYYEW